MRKADGVSFLAGFTLGAAVALLLAPHSGETTRTQMTKAAARGKDSILDYGKTMRHAVVDIVDQSQDYLARQRRGVVEAIQQGSRGYRRADQE